MAVSQRPSEAYPNISFNNQHMIKSFGRDMIGELCWNVYRGESGPCSYCKNDQFVDENGKPAGVCVWQDKNPITGNWYINHDRAIEWTDGRLAKLQIATDITELKKMEEERRQAHKMDRPKRSASRPLSINPS
jgi:two-component system cell cycle sensor histidine kinase/response regulator CckA